MRVLVESNMEQRLNQMVLVQYVNWYAAQTQKEISIGMEMIWN